MLISFLLLLCFISCGNNHNRQKDIEAKNAIAKIELEADAFYEKEDYPKAIIFFNKLIAQDSTKAMYYFKRGYSYSMLFNTGQAIRDYLKSVELGADKYKAYRNIGINYSTINDSLAIYYFDKCLEINPGEEKVLKEKEECKKRLRQHMRYL